MRLITGDETGLHKRVEVEGQHITVAGVQARARCIKAMCWASTTNYDRFCIARADRVVSIWSDSKEGMKSVGEVKDVAGPETIGMGYIEQADSVVVCHGNGEVKLSRLGEADSTSQALPGQFNVSTPVHAMALTHEGPTPTLAIGGKENDLQLYDITQGTSLFQAKNVPRDNLDLRVPIWISAIHFLSPTTLVTGTAYKQVRLYDIRVKPRPVKSMDWGDHRVSVLSASHDASMVVVGDVAGLVQLVDLRKMKACGRLAGPAGSVKAVAKHPTQPLLAVVGLDRMLRVYDLKTREQRAMFYLKQRLTTVLFSNDLAKREAMGVKDMEEAEDDVASLDDSDSEDDKGPRQPGRKEKSQLKYDRIREEEDDDDDDDDEEEEEEEEEVEPFGRRGRQKDKIELHITGETNDDDGEEEEEDDEQEEEDDDEGEGEGEEEEEEASGEGDDDFMEGLLDGDEEDDDDDEEEGLEDEDEEEEEEDDEEEPPSTSFTGQKHHHSKKEVKGGSASQHSKRQSQQGNRAGKRPRR